MTEPTGPVNPVIQNVIDDVSDRNRLSLGIEACRQRENDFSGKLEMQLAGVAMIPEARAMMDRQLTEYWQRTSLRNFSGQPRAADDKEVVIGAGFHAAVYCANRVRMGFPKPFVLERGTAEQVGGAFAVSLSPVFRLNSRNRPGTVGFPDQDKALNYLPGGLIQPSMITSEEYPTNADMAWVIRVTLAQYAMVYPDATVTSLSEFGDSQEGIIIDLSDGRTVKAGRVIDARGTGNELATADASTTVLTFRQLMERMGGMFPLRGMQQVAVIGGGDSAKCAVESLLGIAPGNTSAIGLDYVTRIDWYTGGEVSESTCSQFREGQRGRYIRIGQYLAGNESNPSTRLRVIRDRGFTSQIPDGVLVNDRTYDMAVVCTGSQRENLGEDAARLTYFQIAKSGPVSSRETVLGTRAIPFPLYRIGPAADLIFSDSEYASGITSIPANRVAIFRLAPRTAALAAMLPSVGSEDGK